MLGTSAGGGFPQWNCRCPNCRQARLVGSALQPRWQSSLALRVKAKGRWLLVNASPDLPRQLEAYLAIDFAGSMRESPIEQIFLTNADLDHTLGLLLLREGEPLRVTAPDGVRESLGRDLQWDAILQTSCGVKWSTASSEWQSASGAIEYRAVPLSGATPPRFSRASLAGSHGVGYLFREGEQGSVIGIFPDVAILDEPLLKILRTCAVIFFDGTFWQDDEMINLGLSSRTARQMGHLPVSDSRPQLAALAASAHRIFYLHINNTNPMLDPASPERRMLDESGLALAEDGMRLIL